MRINVNISQQAPDIDHISQYMKTRVSLQPMSDVTFTK